MTHRLNNIQLGSTSPVTLVEPCESDKFLGLCWHQTDNVGGGQFALDARSEPGQPYAHALAIGKGPGVGFHIERAQVHVAVYDDPNMPFAHGLGDFDAILNNVWLFCFSHDFPPERAKAPDLAPKRPFAADGGRPANFTLPTIH
jgi:hypothetical protein